MSTVKSAFDHGKAFIAFLTCGDPDLETTETLVRAIAEAGADLIELGIPFSDPTAEGPVIQAANLRALSGGATTDGILDMARRVRERVDVPLALMTYANVVFSYGTDRFLESARRSGVGALILPDVPFEEKADFAPACKKYGVDFISLVAPTSERRITMIAREAEGFVYCVSSLGVTGARDAITSDVGKMVELVRASCSIPAAIGFGISTPRQAAEMAEKADGVIVGSAIVKLVAQYGRDAAPHVFRLVDAMKRAIRPSR
ncbi:MAG: tryptophan synthase subunit alpha [Clostridiales bacterium]|nr:tryptophan synthase subunit alpha [Clostridiales bacterium]